MTSEQQRLLFAAYRLAERGELYRYEPDKICAEAGMPPETMGRCFPQERDFWVGLHRLNTQVLVDGINKATEGLSAGRERLRAGATAFWDGCVRTLPVRSLVRNYRGDPDIQPRLARINWAFAHMLSMEMKTIGWLKHYNEAAHLVWYMAQGIVRMEFEANGPLPALRQTFWDFIDGTPPARGKVLVPRKAKSVKSKAAKATRPARPAEPAATKPRAGSKAKPRAAGKKARAKPRR